MRYLISATVFVCVFIHKANTLQCWSCSSDIIPQCNDQFNQSDILAGRGGSLYDNLQQNYQDRQRYDPNFNNPRQYDPNFNNQRQYDPNFNNRQGQFNQNYNPNSFGNGRLPTLELCDENEARNRRMRNVCLKEIVRGRNYVSVVRRCDMIPLEETVGDCKQSVNRGLLLDFCQYCEYDGCNSANGLKFNIFLAAVTASLLTILHSWS